MFNLYKLDLDPNIFNILSDIELEKICEGRHAGIIVKPNQNGDIPIVRTTTKYKNCAYKIKEIHNTIINKVKDLDSNLDFNNIMIEIYEDDYKTMGLHSDQELDLEPDSYIAIYSCYDKQDSNTRTLEIFDKITKKIVEKIVLKHNHVLLFSTNTNKKYLHRIVHNNSVTNTKWLGLTMRLSKTYINYDTTPHFIKNGEKLVCIDNVEFYKMKGLENKSIDFKYPESINYTISESDLIPPL
jgi:hypothetical protein